MKKLTDKQTEKFNLIGQFIAWYSKEYGTFPDLAENNATDIYSIQAIFISAAGLCISGTCFGSSDIRRDHLENSQVNDIYRAIQKEQKVAWADFIDNRKVRQVIDSLETQIDFGEVRIKHFKGHIARGEDLAYYIIQYLPRLTKDELKVSNYKVLLGYLKRKPQEHHILSELKGARERAANYLTSVDMKTTSDPLVPIWKAYKIEAMQELREYYLGLIQILTA